jgi:nickel transport protein
MNINRALKGSLPLFLTWILALFLSLPQMSDAHKINVFAWLEGDQVHVDAYFTKSSKVLYAPVKVLDVRGNLLLSGSTNEQGQWGFYLKDLSQLPPDGLNVVVEEGSGHRAEYLLTRQDLAETHKSQPFKEPALKPLSEINETQSLMAHPPALVDRSGAIPGCDVDQIKTVFTEVLDSKLQPVFEALVAQHKLLIEEHNKGPSVSEIIGGVGWIVGLFGIVGYFLNRRAMQK